MVMKVSDAGVRIIIYEIICFLKAIRDAKDIRRFGPHRYSITWQPSAQFRTSQTDQMILYPENLIKRVPFWLYEILDFSLMQELIKTVMLSKLRMRL